MKHPTSPPPPHPSPSPSYDVFAVQPNKTVDPLEQRFMAVRDVFLALLAVLVGVALLARWLEKRRTPEDDDLV